MIERAIVLTQGEWIDQSDLVLSNLSPTDDSLDVGLDEVYASMSLAEVERRHIAATLESTGWNKSQAASILGIERSTLDRKIRRYELTEDAGKSRR